MTGIPVLAIIGPTAVGKTAISLDLARRLNAEIISVDSRQVYRYMDVGTDKIDLVTRKEILHHLLDVVDPDEIFSAADFVRLAEAAAKRIISRGRVPLFVGGTPFYYKALFDRVLTVDFPADRDVRKQLELRVQDDGRHVLHEELKLVDPESAERINQNDTVRVIRALEIFKVSGKTATWWYRQGEESPDKKNPWDILYLGLNRPREELCKTIAKRVKEQFNSGYPEEVAWLLSHGYSPDLPSMLGFGYKELVLYNQGKMSFDDAVQSDIIATRQFAKRQMTWFKKFSPVIWHDMPDKGYNELLLKLEVASKKHLDRVGG